MAAPALPPPPATGTPKPRKPIRTWGFMMAGAPWSTNLKPMQRRCDAKPPDPPDPPDRRPARNGVALLDRSCDPAAMVRTRGLSLHHQGNRPARGRALAV